MGQMGQLIRYYPNDPYFKYQTYLHNEKNNMEDIGYLPYYNYFMEHKKEILDKYKAIKGALPVLAILDGDYDPFDMDLKNRVWINLDEDPYNNKDDDGNGWVDDYSIMNFIDKKVYPVSGGRSPIAETNGEMLYGTKYPPTDPFLSNPDYHGHYMALLAGAEQDNNNGWHGILPDEVKLLLLTSGHKIGQNWIATRDALDYVIDMKAKGLINIVAVNMSFAGGFYQENFFGYDTTFGKGAFENKLKQLNDNNISYVAAAGNNLPLYLGHDIDLQPQFPASFNQPNGIVVAAAASYNAVRAWMSNYGLNTVDIFTISQQDPTIFEYNNTTKTYSSSRGGPSNINNTNNTSSATAITSAIYTIASLLYPECNHLQVKQILLDSYMSKDNLYGLTKAFNRITHDGITRLSGEGRNELGNLIGLVTRDIDAGEEDYHLNVELRKKICGR
jgi:hypothetical protein